MKIIFFKGTTLIVLASACLLCTISAAAQNVKNKKQQQEEIIIKKKGDKDGKMTIIIEGDKITVNGEPLAEFKDDDIIIRKRNLFISPDEKDWGSRDLRAPHTPYPPTAPMPPQLWEFGGGGNIMINTEPKAVLGVYTEMDVKGAKINQVLDSSAAEKGGLMKGDIITKAGDKIITDPSSLSAVVSELKPGDEVQLQYLRDNKQKTVKVKLGERKSSTRTFNLNMPPFNEDIINEYRFRGPHNRLGALDLFGNKPQLGIGIQDMEEGDGVKVLDVQKASPAEKAGIQKDDIITFIDDTAIKNTDDASNKISEIKDKQSYTVKVERNGATLNTNVKIPKKLKTTHL